jgi:hypothetical protein
MVVEDLAGVDKDGGGRDSSGWVVLWDYLTARGTGRDQSGLGQGCVGSTTFVCLMAFKL